MKVAAASESVARLLGNPLGASKWNRFTLTIPPKGFMQFTEFVNVQTRYPCFGNRIPPRSEHCLGHYRPTSVALARVAADDASGA